MMCLQKVSEQHQILVNHYNIWPECMLPQNFKESTIFSINCLLTLSGYRKSTYSGLFLTIRNFLHNDNIPGEIATL